MPGTMTSNQALTVNYCFMGSSQNICQENQCELFEIDSAENREGSSPHSSSYFDVLISDY